MKVEKIQKRITNNYPVVSISIAELKSLVDNGYGIWDIFHGNSDYDKYTFIDSNNKTRIRYNFLLLIELPEYGYIECYNNASNCQICTIEHIDQLAYKYVLISQAANVLSYVMQLIRSPFYFCHVVKHSSAHGIITYLKKHCGYSIEYDKEVLTSESTQRHFLINNPNYNS